MCRKVPAATESYGVLSRSNSLEFFQKLARDAATSEIWRDAELNDPQATLAWRVEQVPNEPILSSLRTQNLSFVKVVGERLSRQKAESPAIAFHQDIDGI